MDNRFKTHLTQYVFFQVNTLAVDRATGRTVDVRNLFYAGIVAWDITDQLELTATVGTQRGGIKCISGVCRDYPAFAGGRLEIVGRL